MKQITGTEENKGAQGTHGEGIGRQGGTLGRSPPARGGRKRQGRWLKSPSELQSPEQRRQGPRKKQDGSAGSPKRREGAPEQRGDGGTKPPERAAKFVLFLFPSPMRIGLCSVRAICV
jgi:hypothetical protein